MIRAALLASCLVPAAAEATVYTLHTTDATWPTTLNSLAPGDEVIFTGGTYVVPSSLNLTVVGTAAQPILIHTDGTPVTVSQPNTAQNTIQFTNAQYMTLEGIEFVGGAFGVVLRQASFVTIRNCSIHGTQNQGLVAVGSSQTFEGLTLLQNEIYGTGLAGGTAQAMYLGAANETSVVKDSLIQGNYLHDTNAAGVTLGFGIEMFAGSSGNTVADNVIQNTGGAPCILVQPTLGDGGPNIIERNFVFGCGDNGIQVSQDAIIQNNIVLSVATNGISVQPLLAAPTQGVSIVHNTVINPTGSSIYVSASDGGIVVANNALYPMGGNAFTLASGTAAGIQFVGNVGLGTVVGVTGTLAPGSIAADFVAASWSGAPPMDAFPMAGGALPDAGATAFVPFDDFNGTPRHGVADVGAYAFAAGGNPGWILDGGFKTLPPDAGAVDSGTPPTDAGSQQDAGVGTDAGSTTDAGAVQDAGSGRDAGTAMDSGSGAPDAGSASAGSKGCGCGSTGTPFAALLLLAAAVLWRRRRWA